MLHFINKVYTVFKGKKNSDKIIQYKFKKKYNLIPLDMYNGFSQVYCNNSKGKYIILQRVKNTDSEGR